LAIHSSTFTPALSDSFKIISGATSRTGTFDTLTGATVGGVEYTPQYQDDLPRGVTLTVNNAPPPPKPTNTVAPSIPTSATEGDTITCLPGTWTGSPTFVFEWRRDGAPIASGSSYQL